MPAQTGTFNVSKFAYRLAKRDDECRFTFRTNFRLFGFWLLTFSGLTIGTHQDCDCMSGCCALTAILDASQSASVL
jgi:hypothetical protein